MLSFLLSRRFNPYYTDASTLTKMVKKANNLPWKTDVQIKNNLVAVYIAERNASIENESDINALIGLQNMWRILFSKIKN
ncbi:hypothetical protein LI82_02475 [Methanococcoides methylutens]|uniref:Uncharacterized protein n=1 Tax=Methanococcoides methylutens TaxID=2226 RepID=A0A099T5I7_METMT|nr:hypothetical protein [Methanococcoides methylutens]KGK99423.1 hypothetical protein LI82_02475 [Methanococcoides methylutens]